MMVQILYTLWVINIAIYIFFLRTTVHLWIGHLVILEMMIMSYKVVIILSGILLPRTNKVNDIITIK